MAERRDQDAIRELLVQYCHLCDDAAFDEWAELFTEDAEFAVLGDVHRGRREIQAFISDALPPERRGKHLISEPSIEIDDSEARVRTDYAFVGRAGKGLGITSAGRYHDRMVKRDGRWLIARREIVFLGDEPT